MRQARGRQQQQQPTQVTPQASSSPSGPGRGNAAATTEMWGTELTGLDGTPTLDAAAGDPGVAEQDPRYAEAQAAIDAWLEECEGEGRKITEARMSFDEAARQAREALQRGDGPGYEGARIAFEAAFRDASVFVEDVMNSRAEVVEGLSLSTEELDRAFLEGTLDLHQLRQAPGLLDNAVAASLDDELAYAFVPTVYEGPRQAWPLPGDATIKVPTHSSVQIGEATASSSATNIHVAKGPWMALIHELGQRYQPVLDLVPELIEWAGGLPADADRSILARHYPPIRDLHGRERAYAVAVLNNHVPEGLAEAFDPTDRRLGFEATLLDKDRDADVEGMDASVREILSQLDDVHMDDDVVMEALQQADSPAEREYILTRLLHLDRGGNNALDHMSSRLDGDELREYDAYVDQADSFSHGLGKRASDTTTLGSALKGSAVSTPGATISAASGAIASVPIAGDFYDKHVGGVVQEEMADISAYMGADEDAVDMSMSIGHGTGKLVGSVLGAHYGGPVWAAADMINNLGQAVTGEKVTGDAISDKERAAAGVGALGGLAEAVAPLMRTAGVLSKVDDAGNVVGKASTADRVMDAGENAVAMTSGTLKMSDADDKQEAAKAGSAEEAAAAGDSAEQVGNMLLTGLEAFGGVK